MEPERSLPCSQEPDTGPCPEPDASSPPHFPKIHCNIFPSTTMSSKWSLPCTFSNQNRDHVSNPHMTLACNNIDKAFISREGRVNIYLFIYLFVLCSISIYWTVCIVRGKCPEAPNITSRPWGGGGGITISTLPSVLWPMSVANLPNVDCLDVIGRHFLVV